jgi:hypothetical protein
MSWMLNQILDWFAKLLLDCLNAMIDAITHVLLLTPDVTTLPQVQALTGRSVWIVDSCFILVFITAGVLTMVAGGNEKTRFTVKDLLPRCIVGFVAAHFSQLIAGQLIALINAITTALTDKDLNNDGALQAIKTDLIQAQTSVEQMLFLTCLVIVLFLLAATACSMIVRIAVAIVLTAAAPLALACHALPMTDPVARLWWRSFIGLLAVPLIQAFVLFAGQWMLLDPHAMLPSLGVVADPGHVLNLFVVMVLLWTTVKVPGLVRRYVSTGARNGNFLGAVVRVVVVQQLTRGLKIPGVKAAVK